LDHNTSMVAVLRQMHQVTFDGTATDVSLTVRCGDAEYIYGEMSSHVSKAVHNGIVGFLAYVLPDYEEKGRQIAIDLERLQRLRFDAAGE